MAQITQDTETNTVRQHLFPPEVYDDALKRCADELQLPSKLLHDSLTEDQYSVLSRGYVSFPVFKVPQLKADQTLADRAANAKKQKKPVARVERKRVPYSETIVITEGEGDDAVRYELDKYKIYQSRKFQHVLRTRFSREFRANMFYVQRQNRWVLNVAYAQ